MENEDTEEPAMCWNDWEKWEAEVVQKQDALNAVGVVPMLVDVLLASSSSEQTPLFDECVLTCVAVLIGGNPKVHVRCCVRCVYTIQRWLLLLWRCVAGASSVL